MAETMEWTGLSGKTYTFWIYKLGATFDNVAGNYIFARETMPGKFLAIYVGQTADLSERFDNHHKMPCITRQRATHICAHTNKAGEAARLAEESDLINKWKPTCND